MIHLNDPFAFRSRRPSDAVQAAVAPLDAVPAVQGLDAHALGEWLSMTAEEITAEAGILGRLVDVAVLRCMAATGYVPAQMGFAIRWDRKPADIRGRGGAGVIFEERSPWFEIPRGPVVSVDAVEVNGDPVSEYDTDLASNPPRVALPWGIEVPEGLAVFEIRVTAGDQAPDPRFVEAALQLAGHAYDHRGCEMAGAMRKSGARATLAPIRVYSGGL